MKRALLATLFWACAGSARAADYGILLLAHGGAPEWNETVAAIAAAADKQAPTELALGMADADALQSGIDELRERGVHRVVAVPLFIDSRSEVMDQTRYALGLSTQPSIVLRDRMAEMMKAHAAMMAHMTPTEMAEMHHHMGFSLKQVKTTLPIILTPALDDSAIVTGILWRRALALSREPARETVILVGHGPVDDAANRAWLAAMRAHAGRLLTAGRFRDVEAVTIRDDSREPVKRAALEALRGAVQAASAGDGRVIVIPYLISRGGIEEHVTAALNGLSYAWDGRTLCPDPAIERWVSETARRLSGEMSSSSDWRESEQNLTLNKLN